MVRGIPIASLGWSISNAGYQYAFDNGKGSTMEELRKGPPPPQPPEPAPADKANFRALQAWTGRIRGITFPEAEFRETNDSTPDGHVGKFRTPPRVPQAFDAGRQKSTNIPTPILAIFADPQSLGPAFEQSNDPAVKAFASRADAWASKQAKAFEEGVPTARVVRLPHANHYVFISNEGDVLREMRAFLAGLR